MRDRSRLEMAGRSILIKDCITDQEPSEKGISQRILALNKRHHSALARFRRLSELCTNPAKQDVSTVVDQRAALSRNYVLKYVGETALSGLFIRSSMAIGVSETQRTLGETNYISLCPDVAVALFFQALKKARQHCQSS